MANNKNVVNQDSHDANGNTLNNAPSTEVKNHYQQSQCTPCNCSCSSEQPILWFLDFLLLVYITVEFSRRIALAICYAFGKNKKKDEEADLKKSQAMLNQMNQLMATFSANRTKAAASAPMIHQPANHSPSISYTELVNQPLTLKQFY